MGLPGDIVRFGDLTVGDYVLSPVGEPVQVTAAYEEHVPSRMFEIEFDNGVVVNASGNHLWYVITDADTEDFGRRKRDSKRLLRKTLDKDTVEALEALAADTTGRVTSLEGMVTLLHDNPSNMLVSVVARCAEAIGVCEEHTYTGVGFEEDQVVSENMVPMYDEARLAQQLLLLLNHRKYRTYGAVLPGRVLKTTQLEPIFDMVEIPEPVHG